MSKIAIISKIWGEEEVFADSDWYTGKILHLKPGFRCSTHCHRLKEETFYVLAGEGIIWLDGIYHIVAPGLAIHIKPGKWHFFASRNGMTLVEASTRHDDRDVERLDESRMLDPQEDAFLWSCLPE